jgi:hypothetical protein
MCQVLVLTTTLLRAHALLLVLLVLLLPGITVAVLQPKPPSAPQSLVCRAQIYVLHCLQLQQQNMNTYEEADTLAYQLWDSCRAMVFYCAAAAAADAFLALLTFYPEANQLLKL